MMQAVERVTASDIRTPDLGGKATTREVANAVCDVIHGFERIDGERSDHVK